MSDTPAHNLVLLPTPSDALRAACTPSAPQDALKPSTPITPDDTTVYNYLTQLITHLYPPDTTSSPHELVIARTDTAFRAAITTMESNELLFRVAPQTGATRADAMQGVIDVLEQKAEKKIARVEMLVLAKEKKRQKEAVKRQEIERRLEEARKSHKEAEERQERERYTREGGLELDVKSEEDWQ